MGILNHLTQEHEWIREILNVVRREIAALALRWRTTSNEFENLEALLNSLEFFVHEIHHEKEEVLLFPNLDMNPRIREGGPRCTYFFKYVMEKTHVTEIMAASKSSAEILSDSKRTPFVREMFKKNSPLKIPLEEHEYGHVATIEIRRIVDDLKSDVTTDFTRLSALYESYFQLMDLHIRKENECLFVLANELLMPPDNLRLGAEAIDFETKIGADKMNRHREIILKSRR